jgi:hypothetical protein
MVMMMMTRVLYSRLTQPFHGFAGIGSEVDRGGEEMEGISTNIREEFDLLLKLTIDSYK